MSIFRRNPHPDDLNPDEENDTIDPELRLRSVRTAASTIAESILVEQRAERRKSIRKKRSNFFRRQEKRAPPTSDTKAEIAAATPQITGVRRNIYVNRPLPPDELDNYGEPVVRYVRNKVRTSSKCIRSVRRNRARLPNICVSEYTIVTFIPKNLYEQFRRYV